MKLQLFPGRHLWINFLPLIAVVLMIQSCARNPVTGKREVILVSEAQEIAMGKEYDPEVVAFFGLYDDPTMQSFIDKKGQEMAKVSHRPELKYTFRVLDSPVVNAFAVPGGYVYFTRGIMAHLNNEAEFAGVLGHEIGHITARHSVKQMSRETLAQLGLGVGMIFSPEIAQFGEIASQGMGLLFLKFSRDNESESDELGVEYSSKIGYDAHEMANFFETIGRLSGSSGSEIPDFLSTHPNPADRNKRVHELASNWQQASPNSSLKVNRESYLQLINGLVYGEDPRQGFVENNMFYHPEMKFKFPVPENWQVVNTPSQVQIGSENGEAMLSFSLSNGSTAREAAENFVNATAVTVNSNKSININGMNSIYIIAEQRDSIQPEASVRLIAAFIPYNNMVFTFYGVTYLNKFDSYRSVFAKSLKGFDKLTDTSKLNVQPERVQIKKVNTSTTLKSALLSNGIQNDRLEEHAILNGMTLSESLKSGSSIKVIQ